MPVTEAEWNVFVSEMLFLHQISDFAYDLNNKFLSGILYIYINVTVQFC